MNKINKQTKYKQTHRYRKQTDSDQRQEGLGDWVKKVKELRKKLIDSDNSIVINRRKRGWGQVEEDKGLINSDGKRLDLGGEHNTIYG